MDPDETQVATAESDIAKPRKIPKAQNIDKIEEEKENEEGQTEKTEGGEQEKVPGKISVPFLTASSTQGPKSYYICCCWMFRQFTF